MTSTTFLSRAPAEKKSRSVYLVHQAFDLLFVCGGLVLILTSVSLCRFGLDIAAPQQDPALIAVGVFGTYMLSGPHAAGTLFRLYGEAQNRNQFKIVAYLLPLVLIAFAIAGLFVPLIAALLGTMYMLLVWHHFMAQSYGVAMMYCARAGLLLEEKEKLLPRLILSLAVMAAVAQQFSPASQRQTFLGINLLAPAVLPASIIFVLQLFLILILLGFVIEQSHKRRSGDRAMPMPAVVTMVIGALFLLLGHALNELLWLFVPNFFHATQYLAVLLRSKFKSAANAKKSESSDPVAATTNYFSRLFIVGLCLFTVIPLLVSRLGFSFPLCYAMAFFSLGLHHFAADACIWKLKNKSNLSRLIA